MRQKTFIFIVLLCASFCNTHAQSDKLIIEQEDKVNPYPESGKACIEFRSTIKGLIIRDTYGYKAIDKGTDPKTGINTIYELIYNVEEIDPKMTIYISSPDFPNEVKLEQTNITSKARFFYTVSTPFKTTSKKQFRLNGYIKDVAGRPINGVKIQQLGTQNAAVTDKNGYFSLETTGKGTLKISDNRYASLITPIDNQTERSFVLNPK